jgi:hypothetical protein
MWPVTVSSLQKTRTVSPILPLRSADSTVALMSPVTVPEIVRSLAIRLRSPSCFPAISTDSDMK